jgi:oligopeptide transport system permease protein
MLIFIFRRIIWFVLVLFAIATISFFLMRFVPGGPFDRERNLPEAIEKNLRAKYNMDKPLLTQYLLYMKQLCRGDLGPSFKYRNRTVNEIIAQSFPASAILGTYALTLAAVAGITIGTIAAAKHRTVLDFLPMSTAMIGICIPSFFLGVLLLLLFCFKLSLLPASGWGSLSNLVLPVVTLSAPFTAYIARLMRASMLEVLSQDYIRTARAKGLPERVVIMKHAMKNAILPVVSYLGPAAAAILTGSIVIEKIFAIPGLGTHFVNGALNRDYTLVMGTILLYSALLVIFNFLVDITYHYIDPRIKLG